MGFWRELFLKDSGRFVVLDNKEIVEKELQKYYSKKKEELEKEYIRLQIVKEQSLKTFYKQKDLDFAKECAKQKAEHEHDFHSGLEEKRTQLAKLDAQIEERKKFLVVLGELIDDKRPTDKPSGAGLQISSAKKKA